MVLTSLWVSPVGDMGGVARHVMDVARSGVPGWRLVFLVPPGTLTEGLQALGAPVIEAKFGPEAGLRSSVRTLRRVIARLRPDVVHTHLSYADIVAAMAATGQPVKLVTTEHGIAANDLVYHGSAAKSQIMAAAHTIRLRRFDAAIAVSEATRKAMTDKWHPSLPIHVVYNGIDQIGRPIPQAGLRIASVARLSPEKRIDLLIQAFGVLADTHRDATLTIAGDGPERDRLTQIALPWGDRVRFLGFVPAGTVLSHTDVLAQLSVWENCSYTLLDAQAAGLGVVATDVGGNPELLPKRCLVSGDDVTAITSALVEQGRELSARPTLGDWPSVTQMCSRIRDIYDGIGR